MNKKEFVNRNIGVISKSEQQKLFKSKVAIAGTGGIGGLLAERLTRIGVGELHLTDPDCFDISNLNRQYSSNSFTLDKKKVAVIKNELIKINPFLKIFIDSKGIHCQRDADTFIEGTSIVVDEMNFGLIKEAIYLQRAARNKNKYYMFSSAIGFGCRIVIFHPKGMTLEEYNGLSTDIDLDKCNIGFLPIQKVSPKLPEYIKKNIRKIPLNSILKGECPVPVISIGVGLASIVTANEVVNILLGLRKIPVAPQYIYIDMLEQKYSIEKMK